MKALIVSVLMALIAMASHVHAQKVFKVTDVVEGKTILQHAKILDADALIQTASVYKPGISEATFVSDLQSSFPPQAASFKHLYTPYFKYIYSLHKRGMTGTQIKETTTGVELAALFTGLNAWNINNPGVMPQPEMEGWRWWKQFLYMFVKIATGTIYL
ncbi:MAG: hypothetical protein V1775_10415 [Bacteroidota bacterium]